MINVIDLKKSFGDLDVLTGITTNIEDGEKVVVIGPSGSGKSTFLRCLNCMEDATSGSIIFDGVDIADMSVDINVHRRHMGMVFQQFNLFANKTVLQNITLAPVTIGLADLTLRSHEMGEMTFQFFVAFCFATVVYIIISLVINRSMTTLEKAVAIPGLIRR